MHKKSEKTKAFVSSLNFYLVNILFVKKINAVLNPNLHSESRIIFTHLPRPPPSIPLRIAACVSLGLNMGKETGSKEAAVSASEGIDRPSIGFRDEERGTSAAI